MAETFYGSNILRLLLLVFFFVENLHVEYLVFSFVLSFLALIKSSPQRLDILQFSLITRDEKII